MSDLVDIESDDSENNVLLSTVVNSSSISPGENLSPKKESR